MSQKHTAPVDERLTRVVAYLRIIAKTISLAEAQREARLALKVLGEDA